MRRAVTWDCGYAHPAPTMQYTASSLAQPVTRVLQPALRTAVVWDPPLFDELWFRATGRPPATTAVLFMHERFTPAGERFILTGGLNTTLGYTGGPQAVS